MTKHSRTDADGSEMKKERVAPRIYQATYLRIVAYFIGRGLTHDEAKQKATDWMTASYEQEIKRFLSSKLTTLKKKR